MSREFRSLSFVRRNASRRTAHVVVYRVLVGSRDVGSLGDSIRGIARRTLFFFFSLLYARCLLCFLDSLVSRVLLLTRLYLRLRTRGSTCLLDPANPECSKPNYSLGYLSCPSPAPRRSIQPSHQFTDASSSVSSLRDSSISHASRVSRSPAAAAPRSLSRRTRLLSPSFHDLWLIPRPSYADVQRDTAVCSGFICYFHLLDRRRQKIIGKSSDTRTRRNKANDP